MYKKFLSEEKKWEEGKGFVDRSCSRTCALGTLTVIFSHFFGIYINLKSWRREGTVQVVTRVDKMDQNFPPHWCLLLLPWPKVRLSTPAASPASPLAWQHLIPEESAHLGHSADNKSLFPERQSNLSIRIPHASCASPGQGNTTLTTSKDIVE